MDGACQLALRQQHIAAPGSRTILVTNSISVRGVTAVAPHGVSAILRHSEIPLLADVVTTVAAGGYRIPKDLRSQLLNAVSPSECQCPLGRPGALMSPTELDIVRLVARGVTNAGIARSTGTTEASVRKRLRLLMQRLDARSRAHLVAYAASHDPI
ncbi:LuxR C-terminal-related transcriptional regulator [Streptomyces sp. NPDC056304]|uniref:helix-turn-helix transcriptional regulator n=1 Tax=Streptomyces sp. NPDC056304 TaxID=3345778 RepID=UPI0035E22370